MKKQPTYSIRYVALRTGLKPYLIRTWESRYQAVCPQRSDSNRRCFTDDDVKRLALLKKAVDAGHNISSVASLSMDELDQLIGQDFRIANDDREAPPKTSASISDWESQAARFVEVALSHTIQLEPTLLEKALNEAAVDLPRHRFLQSVVFPLFERIGALWRTGRLKTAHEHMASAIVRAILWEMFRAIETSETAPCLVVATPVGHWHEFGALASALSAAESGWRVSYFGPNLPAEEIAYAAKKKRANALALSLCHSTDHERLVVELKKLRRLVGNGLPIFIGGPKAMSIGGIMGRTNTYTGMTLIEFRDELENIAAQVDDKTDQD
jgi:DNA-binding transcriptional MerR regulator